MKQKNAALGFLGLLYPAHQVLIGEELWGNLDKISLIVASSDIASGEATKRLEKIKRAHKPLFMGFDSKELGEALGHDRINFIGIVGKKASMSFLLKAKKGEQDEKATIQ